MTQRIRCKQCGWSGVDDDALHAPSPFDPRDILIGCPRCREPSSMEHLCDVEGCHELASSGTPTPDGYRFTCHKHLPTQ